MIHGRNTVGVNQIADAGEQESQNQDNCSQRAMPVLTFGSRKALTPLLTASTPVMAVQPLENARSKIQNPTASDATVGEGGVTTGAG